MANTRVFYATNGVFIKPASTTGAYGFVHGMQTASAAYELPNINVNQIGMINPYEQVEDTPNVTFDGEKVIDGCTPLYLLATEGAPSASLTGRQDERTIVAVGIYSSSANYVSGVPIRVIEYSGLQVTSLSYSFTVDGPFTETVSFVGNNAEVSPGGSNKYGTIPTNPTAGGTDEPCALTGCSGGVQFKENLKFTGTYPTLLPTYIPGITSSGTMPVAGAANCSTVPVQSITVSVDLNREIINRLGCKAAYARLVTFPVDVTTEIEVLSQSGLGLSITERGTLVGCEYTNAPSSRIRISTDSGLIIDLGDKNKLTGVTETFGGVDGANSTYTLTLTGQSIMSVYHQNDPSSIVYSGFWT